MDIDELDLYKIFYMIFMAITWFKFGINASLDANLIYFGIFGSTIYLTY